MEEEYLILHCPACERSVKFRSDAAGTRMGCPYCKEPIENRRPLSKDRLLRAAIAVAALAIVMGFVIGFFGIPTRHHTNHGAMAQMSLLANGLTTYEKEWGHFPVPVDNSGEGCGGTKALYQALSGDGDNHLMIDGKPGTNPSTGEVGSTSDAVMIEGIDFQRSRFRLVTEVPGGFALAAPNGSCWHYRVPSTDGGGDGKPLHNTTYDLWSVGFGGDPAQEENWIRNW